VPRETVEGRRLYLTIFYRGPWDILTSWLLGNGRTWRRDVPDGSLRERLAHQTETRDRMWRERYVQSGDNPHRIWKRRPRSYE
jgi:hypothetical protein